MRGGNGLGAPRLVDLDGDRKPDIAYAGDLNGNLWKFDLIARTADGWKLAFDGSPLHVARDAAHKAQPITAAPVWRPHPDGGLVVVYATGRNVTNADRSDSGTHSIYGVYDSALVFRDPSDNITLSGGAPVAGGRDALVAQSVGAEAGVAGATGHRLWNLSSNSANFTGNSASKGWYLDLPVAGERVVRNLEWFDGPLVDVPSMVPAADSNAAVESCGPASTQGRGYITTLNAITGSAPTTQIYGYSAISETVGERKTASRIESSLRYGLKTDKEVIGVCASGQPCDRRLRLGKFSLRPAWRQLQ